MKSSYFNKEGHLNDEGISLFVDALKLEKTKVLPPNIQAHIETCEVCHQQAIDLYEIVGELDYTKQGIHPVLEKKDHQILVRRLIYRIVAAAVLAGLAFYFYNQNNKQDIGPEANFVQEDSLKKDEKAPIVNIPKEKIEAEKKKNDEYPKTKEIIEEDSRELFAMNFTQNEDLDNLLGEVYRSNSFEASSPKNDAAFKKGEDIAFAWLDEDNSRWSFILLNNLGLVIHNADLSEKQYLYKKELPPGLYYWKLESIDDLLHVGKFFVE